MGKIKEIVLMLAAISAILALVAAIAALWPQEELNCFLVRLRLLSPTYCPSSSPASIPTLASASKPEFVIGNVTVRLRDAPSSSSESVVYYIHNVRLPILGVTVDGLYYQVGYNGQALWTDKNGGHVEGDANAIPVVEFTEVVFVIGDFGASLRNVPNSNRTSLVASVRNVRVRILGISPDGSYYQVKYNGQTLWVSKNGGQVEGDPSTIPVILP